MSYIHAALTEDDEQLIAKRILLLESALLPLLGQIAACAPALERKEDRSNTTRGAAVGRMHDAVEAARITDVAPRQLVKILRIWNEAQGLRWRLALSAQRVARAEVRRVGSSRVATEDLEQEATLGLLAAATRFEPGRGVRFAPYAKWWVRAQLTCAIQASDPVRVSSTANELHRNVVKTLHADRVAGIVRPLVDMAHELGVEVHRLQAVMAAVARRAAPDLDDDGYAAVASLPDRGARTPEEVAVDTNSASRLRALVAITFSDRERLILERRYGQAAEPCSIASIARTLRLSSERVRQVERECIRTLGAMFARELDV